MGGWNFTLEPLSFNLEKLNPVGGIKKIFNWQGAVELFKSSAKFAVVAGVAAMLLDQRNREFLALEHEPLETGLAHAGHLYVWAFLSLSLSLTLIAAVDVPFQRWTYARRMRMTKQEVKDESRDMEGRPEIKGRIRKLQREMARRRMMQEVPKADVVVTNPTHYAVALRYDQRCMAAPRVVAKGTDLIALHIRRVAAAHGVPIFEAPPLARALHASTEIEREIPAALYLAVAQVLAYVYQLKSSAATAAVHLRNPSTCRFPKTWRAREAKVHRPECSEFRRVET